MISGVEARNGRFLYPVNDTYIGKCMADYGEWEQDLVEKCIAMTPGDGVIVEVGSNIGIHTVPLARHLSDGGRVYAIEPQRVIFQLLCANVVCNEVFNVYPYHAAVGDKQGVVYVPDIDIGSEYNFGAVTVSSMEGESVPFITIDDLGLERCDLIKVSAEGLESQVLLGAQKTIHKFKPNIFVDYNYHRRGAINFFVKQFMPEYSGWEFNEVIFKEKNFFGATENHFENIYSLGLFLSINGIDGVTESLQKVEF